MGLLRVQDARQSLRFVILDQKNPQTYYFHNMKDNYLPHVIVALLSEGST